MNAVRNGKQVTAVVELRARFDEANNILWARHLEEAGVHVVYGLVGYKIHGKITLVVRKEKDRILRYVHMSTGNYNPVTSRFYTDVGFLTSRPEIGEDATSLFNLLTGICQFQEKSKLVVAPFQLQKRMIAMVRREAENAKKGIPARIIAKLNSLVDAEIIEELYAASSAGVTIELIVRGICCLRPQVKGLSENITVRSIVDRFLEHSRIYYFENGCQPEVYLSSADWMPRNFQRRVEIAWPVEDGNLRERLVREILGTLLADNEKARFLRADGKYRAATLKKGTPSHRSQAELMLLAESRSKMLAEKPKATPRGKVKLARSPFSSQKKKK
jgi:polyphosphate kinase